MAGTAVDSGALLAERVPTPQDCIMYEEWVSSLERWLTL